MEKVVKGGTKPKYRKKICSFYSATCIVLTLLSLMILLPSASATSELTQCTDIDTPGTYVLVNDIINSDDTLCFAISSSDVVLDGNGYTIDGASIGDDTSTCGIYIYDSKDVIIKNFKINGYNRGIEAQMAVDTTIENNEISNSEQYGAFLYKTKNVLVANNLFESNDEYSLLVGLSEETVVKNNEFQSNGMGVQLIKSEDTGIYLNDFIDTEGVEIYTVADTTFNSKEEAIYLYQDEFKKSFIGNYYDRYSGKDADGDGIGDSPYRSWLNDLDNYPLISKSENYRELETNIVTGCTVIDEPGYYVLGSNIKYSNAKKCIEITADDVILEGSPDYSITGIGDSNSIGVAVTGNRVTIKNLMINEWGYAIEYFNSNDGEVYGNILSNNDVGIKLYYTDNSKIGSNNIDCDDEGKGIILEGSNGNSVEKNVVSRSNKVYGANGVGLFYSSENSVEGNEVYSSYKGIILFGSDTNTVYGNMLEDNDFGLSVYGSDSNEIRSNQIKGNGIGLRFQNVCANNKIYLNDFINNNENLLYESGDDYTLENREVDLKELVYYRYAGLIYTGVLGNYYSDFEASDADMDGVFDSAYEQGDCTDMGPLVEQSSNYVTLGSNEPLVCQSGCLFSSIQDAVNNVGEMSVITVGSGLYHENVVIDRKVSLQGVDTGSGMPIIDGGKTGDCVKVTPSVQGIIVEGFTIQNSGESQAGIKIESENNIIRDNILEGNYRGIYATASSNILNNKIIDSEGDGIKLTSNGIFYVNGNEITECQTGININSINSVIENNIIKGGQHGIISKGDGNLIRNNYLSDCEESGIRIIGVKNNYVTGNNISSCDNGVYLYETGKNTLSGNNIEECNVSVSVKDSDENTVKDNIISGINGIWLINSDYNLISGNEVYLTAITHYSFGLFLTGSNENIISLNDFESNYSGVLEISSSYYNVFYQNRFEMSIDVLNSENQWDNGFVGNYYAEFECTDENGNEICDSPHTVNWGRFKADRYPWTGNQIPVPSAPEIRGPYPSYQSFSVETGEEIKFGATINQMADCKLLLDGIETFVQVDTSSPEFAYSFDEAGNYEIEVVAHNRTDSELIDSYTWTVTVEEPTVEPVGTLPLISDATPEQEIIVELNTGVTFTAKIDQDAGYTWSVNGEEIIEGVTGELTEGIVNTALTTLFGETGEYTVTLTAVNKTNTSLTSSYTWTVTVEEPTVATAPVIEYLQYETTVYKGMNAYVRVIIDQEADTEFLIDGGSLAWSYDTANPGTVFTLDELGEHTLTIIAHNNTDSSLTTTAEYTIIVIDPTPTINNPIVSPDLGNIVHGQEVTFAAEVSFETNCYWEVFDLETNNMVHEEWDYGTVSPELLWTFEAGKYHVVLVAYNLENKVYRDMYTWTVTVEEPPVEPIGTLPIISDTTPEREVIVELNTGITFTAKIDQDAEYTWSVNGEEIIEGVTGELTEGIVNTALTTLFGETGEYTVTLSAVNKTNTSLTSPYTWIVTVEEPPVEPVIPTISEVSEIPELVFDGLPIIFSAEVDQVTNNSWTVGGEILEWSNNTKIPSFMYIPFESGEAEVILTAYNRTNISLYTTYKWNFEVISSSLMMEILEFEYLPDDLEYLYAGIDLLEINSTINQLANCSWSINGIIEEWDNVTINPRFNTTFDNPGKYDITLRAYNTIDSRLMTEYTMTVSVAKYVNGGDSKSVQDAIDSANEGDIVAVGGGFTYHNITIDKPITLIGVSGNDGSMPVIDGLGGNCSVNITADGVVFSGFRIKNSTIGLNISGDDIEVSGNTISGVEYGIWLNNSSGSVISDNSVDAEAWAFFIVNSEATFGDNEIRGITFNFKYNGDTFIGGVPELDYPNDPDGWKNINKYLNINSSGWVFLKMTYSDSDIEGLDEQKLKIWRYNNGWHEEGWFELTKQDLENNTVGVNITKFSIFAILGKEEQSQQDDSGQDSGNDHVSSGGGGGGFTPTLSGGNTFLPNIQDIIGLNKQEEDEKVNKDNTTPLLWNKKISQEPVDIQDDLSQDVENNETEDLLNSTAGKSGEEQPKGLTSTKIILTIFLVSVTAAIIIYTVKRKDLLDKGNKRP